MSGEKSEFTFLIQADAMRMLEAARDRYGLPDLSKALRCVLDFVAVDGDWDDIFEKKRCTRCGDKKGWEG